jgi:hypothetical protein
VPFFPVDGGANAAGDGGNGYFIGSLIDDPYAEFGSFNMAQAAGHATASAHQANVGILDQSASQAAGIGGDGGDSNLAMGGSVGAFGGFGSDAIATGDNSAGQGGDGHFMGAMVHAPVAIFDPVNIAVAGFGGAADAHQSNTAQFHQNAFQFAGGGGGGGSGNAATGGEVSSGTAASNHAVSGSGHASGHGLIGSDAIMSGDDQAGNGGDGYFYGSLVHTAIAVYDPINIAAAGPNSSAHADQSNNVTFDQSAIQIAGVGGNGGNGNAAVGGDASLSSIGLSSLLGMIGSDAIATGGNSAGHGGDGHFTGSLVDLSIAIYAPINIAVAAGSNSTADASQTNNVAFDQGAIQIAGIGGDGGHGNAALGGDFAAHLLGDLHLIGHG